MRVVCETHTTFSIHTHTLQSDHKVRRSIKIACLHRRIQKRNSKRVRRRKKKNTIGTHADGKAQTNNGIVRFRSLDVAHNRAHHTPRVNACICVYALCGIVCGFEPIKIVCSQHTHTHTHTQHGRRLRLRVPVALASWNEIEITNFSFRMLYSCRHSCGPPLYGRIPMNNTASPFYPAPDEAGLR